MGHLTRLIAAMVALTVLSLGAVAQEGDGQTLESIMERQQALEDARAATGGAPTEADVLRAERQGESLFDLRCDDSGAEARPGAAPATGPLGTLGGASDPDLWRALRCGTANVTSQVQGPAAQVLVQDSGIEWLQFREGPLRVYGGYFLLIMIAALALFYLIRGRIRIDHGRAGIRIQRFTWFERFSHWVLAVSFILLAITGLIAIFGRNGLMDVMGRESYATLALWSKYIHNNVAWAFMLALVAVFFLWVWHNLPSRTDVVWLLRGGGMFGGGHPPAKKFNAGQKLIFWSVVIFGASVSASGLALLFPFELNLFAPTFAKLNDIDAPGWFGYGTLPETLAPHSEMQLAQTWHAIIGFVMMGIVIAHIYLGTIGMEGAFEAMGSGEVDLNWAREHHSLWAEKVVERGEANQVVHEPRGTPAE